MELYLTLYTSDIIYGTRLMDYFKNTGHYNFNVSIFTDIKNLDSFIKNTKEKIDILLLEEKSFSQEQDKKGEFFQDNKTFNKIVKKTFLITESKNKEKDIEYDGVYKYQSAEKIIKEVIGKYEKSQGICYKKSIKNKTRIISVFSQTVNINKSIFAGLLAKRLSKQGKTLLIELELFPLSIANKTDVENHGVSELIYFLKEKSEINSILKEILKPDLNNLENLHSLVGVTHALDILSLDRRDIHKLISSLREESNYENVVFYISFYSNITREIIRLSDSACIPYIKNIWEEKLIKEWERQAALMPNKEEIKKIMLPEVSYEDAIKLVIDNKCKSELANIAYKYCEGL